MSYGNKLLSADGSNGLENLRWFLNVRRLYWRNITVFINSDIFLDMFKFIKSKDIYYYVSVNNGVDRHCLLSSIEMLYEIC